MEVYAELYQFYDINNSYHKVTWDKMESFQFVGFLELFQTSHWLRPEKIRIFYI